MLEVYPFTSKAMKYIYAEHKKKRTWDAYDLK